MAGWTPVRRQEHAPAKERPPTRLALRESVTDPGPQSNHFIRPPDREPHVGTMKEREKHTQILAQ
jgi:hypothetical protein